jgi:hypothetical protein
MTLTSNGSLGIGTSTPDSLLHIYGSGNTFTRYTNTTNTGHYIDIGANSAGQSFVYGYGAYPLLFGTNGATQMTILSGGNVGIGTANPTARLHVDNSSVDTVIRISKGASTIGNVDLVNEGNRFSIQDDGVRRFVIDTSGNVGIGTVSPSQILDVVGKMRITDDIILAQTNGRIDYDNGVAGSLRFFTTSGSAERMRITSAGNVGIGTTSPASRLHVVGSATVNTREVIADFRNSGNSQRIDIRDENSATSQPPGLYAATAGFGLGLYAGATSAPLILYAGGITTSEERMRILGTNGNVGIGTTNPRAKLDVQTSSTNLGLRLGNTNGTNWDFYSYNDSNLYINNAVGTLLTILNSNGNVGIGTVVPNQKLQVAGPIAASLSNVNQVNFVAYNSGTGLFTYASTSSIVISTATNADNVYINEDATDADQPVLFAENNEEYYPVRSNKSQFFYNPSTGTLTVPSLIESSALRFKENIVHINRFSTPSRKTPRCFLQQNRTNP